MKNIKTKILFVSAVLFIAVFSVISYHQITVKADSGIINSMSTIGSVAVTATSTAVLPAASSRVYVALVDDGSSPIYLRLGSGAATVGNGIRLNANGGAYEINSLNLYVGAISAISATSTNLTITAAQ